MERGSSSPSPSVAPTPRFFPTCSSLFLIFVKTWPRPKADGGGQGKRVHAAISGVASPSPSRLPSTRFSFPPDPEKSFYKFTPTILPLFFLLPHRLRRRLPPHRSPHPLHKCACKKKVEPSCSFDCWGYVPWLGAGFS